MNERKLSMRQREIVLKLREKVSVEKKHLLDDVLNNTLNKGDIEIVCQIINGEFLMNGIEENYEPNEYGNELEELLDIVNRPRLT